MRCVNIVQENLRACFGIEDLYACHSRPALMITSLHHMKLRYAGCDT